VSNRIAFVFPGQGSQAVGMGADLAAQLPAARAVFAEADAALEFPLSELCFNGPETTLRETINTQPAIATTSLAALAALRVALHPDDADALLVPDFVAGHSVGEYTALIAAGAIAFADGIRLIRERGRLMHHEGTICPGGMAAVLGLDTVQLIAICNQAQKDVANNPTVVTLRAHHLGAGCVVVANDNAPGQLIISGEQTALARAMELAQAAGAKRVLPLTVSGAFHSPVMAPAAPALTLAVAKAHVQNAKTPLISNITARPISLAEDIFPELTAQIAAPVRWTETIEWLVKDGGVTAFVELGSGQVLAGLIKRIAKGIPVYATGTPAEVTATAQNLQDHGFVI